MSVTSSIAFGYGGCLGTTLPRSFFDVSDNDVQGTMTSETPATKTPATVTPATETKIRIADAETCSLGAPFQAGETPYMQTRDRKKIFASSVCGTLEPKEWIEQLSRLDNAYLTGKFRLLSDIGEALRIQRKAAELSRVALSVMSKEGGRAGLHRDTIRDIETAQPTTSHKTGFTAFEGSRLGKLVDFLTPIKGHVPFEFKPLDESGRTPIIDVLKYSDDPSDFAQRHVRTMRKAAGLSQAELGQLIKVPKAIGQGATLDSSDILVGSSSPMVSRIENGRNGSGVYCGTLYTIAHVCGYRMTVPMEDMVPKCLS